jgi:hypothetical protein
VPAAPTASAGTNTTQLATTAHVFAERSNAATLTNKTLTSPVINAPTGIVKADVGLGSVDNTSDAAKPVSTAQQTALNLKADLASPTFSGTPSLPTGTTGVTQTAADSTTKLATTAFVTTADNLKANLASPTFTGVPAAPTASPGTNTTQLATTAFAAALVALKANVDNPTFTTAATSPKFLTASGTTGGVATGVAGLIYTLPNVGFAAYLVSASINAGDATNYGAFAVILADGTTTRIALGSNAGSQTITVSGLSVYSTQSSGTTQTLSYVVTRIG